LRQETGGIREWFFPSGFVVSAGFAIWHMPAYMLTLAPHSDPSRQAQVLAQSDSADLTPNPPGLFGGAADILDWAALVLIVLFAVLGVRGVKATRMEFQAWRAIDRFAIFVGRVAMVLIIAMTGVMLFGVFRRFAFEAPTLWANPLALWIGGFVFLCSGLYAMQQRGHTRIFILHDLAPRWLQRIFDTIWTAIFVIFAIGMMLGSYKQVFVTGVHNWEMFGTAFDARILATVQPAILIVVCLVALQSVLNLINDWNLEPVLHSAADDFGDDELEAIKRAVGGSGVADTDVTRARIHGAWAREQ